jgi:membrane-bound lytic murein transglycosylase A
LVLLPSLAHAQMRAVQALPLDGNCDDLDLAPLGAALNAEIAALQKKGSMLAFPDKQVSARDYATTTLAPLARLAAANNKAGLCAALKQLAWFSMSASQILMTAYHTPSLPGSLTRTDRFKWPLYKRPPDANNFSTAQILAGAFNGRNLELIWLEDPYDALALHVEGGGNIKLPDGRMMHIGADGHNGMQYQNVSKLLVADKKLPGGPPPPTDKPGNPKARKYFSDHPEDLNVYWGRNPHFVYFKESKQGGSGKLGALTPMRSVAIDPAVVPFGALMFIRTQKPLIDQDNKVIGWQPYTRVVLGQDTGSGIKGPGRIDVYYGEDEYAQIASQATSVNGDAFILVAR